MNDPITLSIRFHTRELHRDSIKQHLNQLIGNIIDPQDFRVEYHSMITRSEGQEYTWRLHVLTAISNHRLNLIRLAISEYL
jgi:hypothetical protein